MSGEIVFVERGDIYRELSLPCGQCTWCRVQRSQMWALRCMHENTLHQESAFITLTYDEAHVPDCGLQYRDFQLFMKRLRKACDGKTIRFFMCGEYGDNFGRPHYHALVFGERFSDRVFWRTSESGAQSFRSDLLESVWKLGHSEVGDVSFQSAAYVARYCIKKVTGPNAHLYYGSKKPEFMVCSKGVGRGWFEKFSGDVFPHDFVVHNGKEWKTPKFYDKLMKRLDPDVFEAIQMAREERGRAANEDNSPARLIVKDEVMKARLSFMKRSIC